jgi:Endoplasmic reticulum vesicle transporter
VSRFTQTIPPPPPVILTTDTTSSHLCPVLSLDLMDISGELQRDISHDITKTRLTPTGTVVLGSQVGELRNDIDRLNEQRSEGYCGSCYGGEADEGGCCNSCDSVREAYTRRGWSFSNPGTIDQVRSLRAGVHPPPILSSFFVCVQD